ncbi:MAG TPA: porin [candidate division Zixibacteria bacterium]|nr:porin [candidate division Zixibacteria bacterium]
MNRAALLGGTAIAALLATAPVMAGSVGTGDNMEVTMAGELRFEVNHVSQDDSAGTGRGYAFHTGEGELGIEASNTADNGIKYGFEVVLNINVDDTENADKIYAFLDSDQMGRLQLGSNDDAADSLFVDGSSVLAARAGYDGEVADVFKFGDTWLGVGTDNVGKSNKIVYFTPNLGGFTFGVAFTPDAGSSGASYSERDDDGDAENVIGIAGNWVGEFSGVEIVVAGFGEWGQSENDTSAAGNSVGGSAEPGDVETYGVGATVAYGGFSVGAGWVTFNDVGVSSSDQASGADAGEWWDVGVAYRQGPWGVSVGYYESTTGNVSGVSDTKNTVLTFDADYEVAPGWTTAASLSFNDAENRDRTQGDDNNGHSFILYNIFTF